MRISDWSSDVCSSDLFAARPRGATWLQIYAVAVICGIGFTMSLFIGGLAFSDPLLIEEAKLGTLGGSVLAAIAGYLLLRFAPLHAEHVREEVRQAREIERDGDVEKIGRAHVCTPVTNAHLV